MLGWARSRELERKPPHCVRSWRRVSGVAFDKHLVLLCTKVGICLGHKRTRAALALKELTVLPDSKQQADEAG